MTIEAGTAPAISETFAAYYARYLMAQQNYGAPIVPELAPLAAACDKLVIRQDGQAFVAVAIIDREANPEKAFPLSVAEVQSLASACWPYAPRVGRRQMPATIRVIEIGPGAITPAAVARLNAYRINNAAATTVMQALLVDTTTRKVWPDSRFANVGEAREIEKLLHAPRLGPERLRPTRRTIDDRRPPPFFTYGLIALLFAIFFAELLLNITTLRPGRPSFATLLALGGLNQAFVLDVGQWWRIFTAPLLHFGLAHVGFNCLALLLIGRQLEPLIGARWSAATFAVAAICGSVMSLAVNPANTVGTGASGGIVGLFVAALAVSPRIPSGVLRQRLIRWAIIGLLLAFFPSFKATSGDSTIVDYGGHFGGAIGGGIVGIVLQRLWPNDMARPKWPRFGALAAAGFFVVAAASIVPIIPIYLTMRMMLGVSGSRQSGSETIEVNGSGENETYPREPSALLDDAMAKLRQSNIHEAELELRFGLTEVASKSTSATPIIAANIKALLAVTLYTDGADSEAKSLAATVCPDETTGLYAKLLKSDSLCP